MRIGIITQPLARNYGGILQNYALQQVLLRMGHTPITIDYLPVKERLRHLLSCLRHFRKPDKWFFARHRPQFIKQFIRHHVAKTHRVNRYRAATVIRYRFDVLLAGSDQIWRPKYNKYLSDMYFLFAASLPVKKIVYGASFGTDECEYNSQMVDFCHSLIHQIDAVSVREKSGVALCRHYFGIEAEWVLDPTLLLDVTDYERICASIPNSYQEYLAVYLLDIDKQLVGNIEKISHTLNIPLRLFSADNDVSLSIEEWLVMFRDAKYIITDSFHGTIFSIIFNKPFISIGNYYRGMSRFFSLLGQFGLEDRLSPDISMEKLICPIAWEKINRQKQVLKKHSIRFLETALQGKGTPKVTL